MPKKVFVRFTGRIRVTDNKLRLFELLAKKNNTTVAGAANELLNKLIKTMYHVGDSCPICDTGTILIQVNKKTGREFFNCTNSPKCKFAAEYDE